jgi:hypothetical protein
MDLTALVTVLLVLAVIGLIVYLITTYIPMPPPFKIVIYAVAAIALILWLLKSFPLKF